MISKNLLKRTAIAYGSSEKELEDDLKIFRPVIKQVKTDEITILHFGEQDKNGYFQIRKLNVDNVSMFLETPLLGEASKVSRDVLRTRYMLSDDLIDEIYGFNGDQEIGYAIMADNQLYVPTRDFMATFCNSLGAGFNKLTTGRDLSRDVYIIDHLFDAKAERLNFICKHDPNNKYSVYRVFAAFTESYALHSTENIVQLVKNACDRGYELMKYTMNHQVTDIDFYDPQSKTDISGKKFYQGIRLSWSDIGDASLSFNSTIVADDSIILTDIKKSIYYKLISSENIYRELEHEFYPLLMKETTLFKLNNIPEAKKLSEEEYKSILKDAGINKKAVKGCNLEDMTTKEFALMIVTKSSEIGTGLHDRTSKILQLEQRTKKVICSLLN